MRTFDDAYKILRRANLKNYLLLVGCAFFSTLLITAYVTMMCSPTVLTVLPEGGDSRKQVMMIFVLAVIGCGVFASYAAGLFFRSKSQDTGLFLALGAPKQLLRRELRRELTLMAVIACGAGAALGTPVAWLLWQLFRIFVVDTQQMAFRLEPAAWLFALAFTLFVLVMLLFQGNRFIRRTNIIDIVNESRKSEPIRDVPHWYGWVGILLLIVGGFLGYEVPSFCVLVLHWYAPGWLTAIFYIPVFVGLYMILLHTVVNGWGGKKKKYKDLIGTSMMRFQGRQTVNNMLVITVLLAGAYFGSFYTPMLGVGAMISYDQRNVDYSYHYRADQDIPGEQEIRQLAAQHGVTITDWTDASTAVLAVDGMQSIETEGNLGATWTEEYREVLQSDVFLSESDFGRLTGQQIELPPGTVASIFDDSGSGNGMFGDEVSLVTNPVTGMTLPVTPTEKPLACTALFGRRVLDDGDYAAITAGLSIQWREEQVFFNVENVEETFGFAKALFNEIVDRSGPEVELFDAYDPVQEQQEEAAGGAYYFAPENLQANGFETISYDLRDSSSFRMYWKYMPEFRVLDKTDFVKTTAVFLMLFIFIALICFAAVLVIGYTRCITIALNHAQVYDDLRRLGAGRKYLYQSVRSQVSRVWKTPAVVGTVLIYAFYTMILYANGDDGITSQELAGLMVCLGLIVVFSAILYGFYRYTLKSVCRRLKV